MEKKDYTNTMEEIVETLVYILMSGTEYRTFCNCKKCKTDIIALALNSLPSHYVTTSENRERVIKSLNEEGMRRWINKRIISAIHIVGKYPKHN
jgi:competence protein ComFB